MGEGRGVPGPLKRNRSEAEDGRAVGVGRVAINRVAGLAMGDIDGQYLPPAPHRAMVQARLPVSSTASTSTWPSLVLVLLYEAQVLTLTSSASGVYVSDRDTDGVSRFVRDASYRSSLSSPVGVSVTAGAGRYDVLKE